jgi:hypothetical protein
MEINFCPLHIAACRHGNFPDVTECLGDWRKLAKLCPAVNLFIVEVDSHLEIILGLRLLAEAVVVDSPSQASTHELGLTCKVSSDS